MVNIGCLVLMLLRFVGLYNAFRVHSIDWVRQIIYIVS